MEVSVAAGVKKNGAAGKLAVSERGYGAIADTFRALGDPTRARLVHALSGEERTVNELSAIAGVSASAVSHQLRVLRNMGLVRFRREGQRAYYFLDDPHIERLFDEARRHVTEFIRNR